MREWQLGRLGDLAAYVTVGHVGPMAHKYQGSGVPFLRSQNVRPHRIDRRELKFIDEEFHRELAKSQLEAGDVVIVRTGKPGQAAVIPEWMHAANCSDLVIVRPGPSLESRWLSYYLNWITETHISGQLVGAVQQHFNVGSAKNLELSVPPLHEQRAIAEVLGALDDKIAANDRVLCATDELCAAEVKAAAYAGAWMQLRDLLRLHYGKALPAPQREHGKAVVYGSGGPTGVHSVALVDRPGVVIGRKGTVGAVYWADGPHFPIDTTYYVQSLNADDEVLYYLLRSIRLRDLNSDSAVPGLNREEAYSQRVRVPSLQKRADLSVSLRVRFLWMAARRRESSQLTATRNELLPLLMSGRIRVRDAERAVEEVV